MCFQYSITSTLPRRKVLQVHLFAITIGRASQRPHQLVGLRQHRRHDATQTARCERRRQLGAHRSPPLAIHHEQIVGHRIVVRSRVHAAIVKVRKIWAEHATRQSGTSHQQCRSPQKEDADQRRLGTIVQLADVATERRLAQHCGAQIAKRQHWSDEIEAQSLPVRENDEADVEQTSTGHSAKSAHKNRHHFEHNV